MITVGKSVKMCIKLLSQHKKSPNAAKVILTINLTER